MFGLGLLQTTAIGLCLLIGTSGGAYVWGYERGQSIARIEQAAATLKAVARAAEDARALGIAEGAITFTTEQHAAEVREKIVYRTITRIKEIQTYVTPKADAACVIPIGFVQLHDDAATNQGATLPDPAGQSPDTASDVKLSEVSAANIQNYGTYYQVREQLIALQNWVKQQQALHR